MSDKVLSKVREKYVQRFADMLKPLQSRLSELEQNLDSIKDDHPEKQKARLDVLTEINKTKENIENTKKNLEYSKTIPIIRSDKVPENIPNYNVWNDCWYDEKRKLCITYNKHFDTVNGIHERTHQIEYEKETGDKNGFVFKNTGIKFLFGYPAVRIDYDDETFVNFLLPTMTYEMITKDIVSSRLKPKSPEDSVIYKTEDEAWIDVLGTEITEKEYEIACEVINHIVKTPLDVLKAAAGRPYNKSLFEKQVSQINKEN